MIQIYYAVYSAIRAYFLALGREVNPTHQSALRAISGELITSGISERFPQPWRSVLSSDPKVKRGFYLANSSCTEPINLDNPLASLHRTDPWQFYGLFLRTTRERQLAKKIDQWKREKSRKRALRSERQELLDQLPPTTIFDALFRVRTRANYRDVDSFLFCGELASTNTIELHRDICEITNTTLMVFEILIARASTKQLFSEIVEQFIQASRAESVDNSLESPALNTIGRRWEIARHCW